MGGHQTAQERDAHASEHTTANQATTHDEHAAKTTYAAHGPLPPVSGGGDGEHRKSASEIAYDVTHEKGGEHAGAGEHAGGEHGALEALEHWAHQYAKAMHVPHLAAEGLEKFVHLIGELGAENVHHFMEGAGGTLCKGTLAALCVPMAVAHAKEYAEKAGAAAKAGNSAQATYYWTQAVLSAGSAIPEVGLAFTFCSEMLQVSEGKGLVYEYLCKNIAKYEGNKLRAEADITFANDTIVSDITHQHDGGASANLELVRGGFASREEAFAAIRAMRADALLGQEDFAITKDPGGFAVHKLASNQPLAFDMDNKRELESAALKHDNALNIVALIAEDGTWGRVERVDMGSWARWDVKAAGHL